MAAWAEYSCTDPCPRRVRSRRHRRAFGVLATTVALGFATAGPALASDGVVAPPDLPVDVMPPDADPHLPLPLTPPSAVVVPDSTTAPESSGSVVTPTPVDAPAIVATIESDAANTNVSVRVLSPGEDGAVTQESPEGTVISGPVSADITPVPDAAPVEATPAEAIADSTANTNVSVRVLSPGDNGLVTQTTGAVTSGAERGNSTQVDVATGVPAPGPSNTNVSVRVLSPGDTGSVTQTTERPDVGSGELDETADASTEPNRYHDNNSQYHFGDTAQDDYWNWDWTLFRDCDGNLSSTSTSTGSESSLDWTWNWTWNWSCGTSNDAVPVPSTAEIDQSGTSAPAETPSSSPSEPWTWSWEFAFCGGAGSISSTIPTASPLSWTWDWTWTWPCADGSPAVGGDITPTPSPAPSELLASGPSGAASTSSADASAAPTGADVTEVSVDVTVPSLTITGGRSPWESFLQRLQTWTMNPQLPFPTAVPLTRTDWPLIAVASPGLEQNLLGVIPPWAAPATVSSTVLPDPARSAPTFGAAGAHVSLGNSHVRGPLGAPSADAATAGGRRRPEHAAEPQLRPAPRASAPSAAPGPRHSKLPLDLSRTIHVGGTTAGSGGSAPGLLPFGFATVIGFFVLVAPRLWLRVPRARELGPLGGYPSPIEHPG
jgi:hypothetical protein